MKVKIRDSQLQPSDSATTTSVADGGALNFSYSGYEDQDSKAGRDWQTEAADSLATSPFDAEMLRESPSTSFVAKRELVSPCGGSAMLGNQSPRRTASLALKPPPPPMKELEKIVDKIQKKEIYEIFKDPVTEEMASVLRVVFRLNIFHSFVQAKREICVLRPRFDHRRPATSAS